MRQQVKPFKGLLSPRGGGHTFRIFPNLHSKLGIALFVAKDDEFYVLLTLKSVTKYIKQGLRSKLTL